MDSIDESYKDYDSDDGSISTNAIKDIQDGSKIHPEINAIDDILKIYDRIKQTKSEWKGEELP